MEGPWTSESMKCHVLIGKESYAFTKEHVFFDPIVAPAETNLTFFR